MTILLRSVGFLLLLMAANTLMAQAVIKEKSSLTYSLTGTDSLIRSQKNSTYDPQGRLLSSKTYYYNFSTPGVLVKEETAAYNPTTKILTERITHYPTGKEPQTERLETSYLDYQAKEKNSKRIWRQHFDHYGELTKEDTLAYNASKQLVNNCQYNYMGSTSLLCNEYKYKDTLRTRWITYSKWNTINGKSEVVVKKTKRRDYRYRYNRQGQLKRMRAKDYSSKVRRYLCYDKQGNLEQDHLVEKRNVTKKVRDSEGNRTDKKKTYVQKTEQITLYRNGQVVDKKHLVDGKATQHEHYIYQDTFLEKAQTFVQEKLMEEVVYTYKKGILAEKSINKYASNGVLRYTTKHSYNILGQAVLREQSTSQKVLSITEWTYDEAGNMTSQTSYRPRSSSSKKPMNPIQRPKEKIVYIYTYH